MDSSLKDQTYTASWRPLFAPQILAALLSVPGAHNDDREVAHAVSLADKLARAIVSQPVGE